MESVLRYNKLKYDKSMFHKKIYLTLFCVYLAVELIYGFYVGNFGKNLILKNDTLFYSTAGWNISRGVGYTFDGKTPNATYQVGYPLFLAFLFKIFGNRILPVFIAQYLMGAFSFILFYRIVEEITSRRLLKIIALFLYFTHHVIFFLNAFVLSEPLGLFMFLIFILCLIKYLKYRNKIYLLLASFSCGYLILVRNVFQALPPFLLIFSFFGKRKFLKECLVLLLISFILVAPYAVRNKIIFGSYKLSFITGKNLFEGMRLQEKKSAQISQDIAKNPAKADAERFKFWLSYALKHPLETLKNYAKNFINLLFSINTADKNHHYSILGFFLIFKNVAVFIGIIIYGSMRRTFLNCLGKNDFVFISLIFVYYNAIFSFGICRDGRFGIFSQIPLYLIFVFILDQYLKRNPRIDNILPSKSN